MTWRKNGAMDLQTVATLLAGGMFIYAAWLTSIVLFRRERPRPFAGRRLDVFPRSASCTVSACGSVDGENRRSSAVRNSWRPYGRLRSMSRPLFVHSRPACGRCPVEVQQPVQAYRGFLAQGDQKIHRRRRLATRSYASYDVALRDSQQHRKQGFLQIWQIDAFAVHPAHAGNTLTQSREMIEVGSHIILS